MGYMQGIFTTLWAIWKHRNLVIQEGKEPNPMEVVLIAQNLSCRYKDSFTSQPITTGKPEDQNQCQNQQQDNGNLSLKLHGLGGKNLGKVLMLLKPRICREISCFVELLVAQQDLLMGPRKKLWWRQLSRPNLMASNEF